ncbi:MAG TPA: NUDIX domain-containing protein [Candidatus Paceibacterota bacterium]
MKLLATIRDIDIGSSTEPPSHYEERGASRAVIFDSQKNIALLHATKKNYHKLPGGGIEEGEGVETALRREALEEIGCYIQNIRELGVIEEYRNRFSLHQISHCFIADLAGEKGAPDLQPGEEIEDGFETIWMELSTAVKTLARESDITYYEGKFIQKRDLMFLEEAAARNI